MLVCLFGPAADGNLNQLWLLLNLFSFIRLKQRDEEVVLSFHLFWPLVDLKARVHDWVEDCLRKVVHVSGGYFLYRIPIMLPIALPRDVFVPSGIEDVTASQIDSDETAHVSTVNGLPIENLKTVLSVK